MSDTPNTIPAFDSDNHLSGEVKPGAEMLVEGDRRTVAEVKTRSITFEDGSSVRFISIDYDELEIIVDEGDKDESEEEAEDITLAIGAAKDEDYCRVYIDDQCVAVTDIRRTPDGVELVEDETTVMWLRLGDGAADRVMAAVEQAIQADVGGRITVQGSLEATHNAYKPRADANGGC